MSFGNDTTLYIFVNFIKNEERESFKEQFGKDWSNKIFFSDLILDPFEIKNREVYKNILNPYLLNEKIKEEKKTGIFSIFKKGKR